jgi:hypothetical protein
MVKLVMGHPLAHVGLEHLRREVDDAVHVAVGQRADRTIGHEATDEGAVFTVKPLSTRLPNAFDPDGVVIAPSAFGGAERGTRLTSRILMR